MSFLHHNKFFNVTLRYCIYMIYYALVCSIHTYIWRFYTYIHMYMYIGTSVSIQVFFPVGKSEELFLWATEDQTSFTSISQTPKDKKRNPTHRRPSNYPLYSLVANVDIISPSLSCKKILRLSFIFTFYIALRTEGNCW